ncbi:UNVERIFIED_CONTAM: hypothetical protein Sradi_0749300 [Sesamum radiatum]|uniref:Uncharacterized protein n=1 Tax=Sesamum radiatum TaxID=300843 RepID=A0AAW2VPL1_SESRA
MLILFETKCGHHRIELVKQRLDLFGVCAPAKRKSGGLALLWQQDLSIQLRSYSDFHIDMDVLTFDSIAGWRLTGFYGAAEVAQRKVSWDTLKILNGQSDNAWVCVDFNEIFAQHEKISALRPMWQVTYFRQALDYYDLSDLGYEGSKFKWCNRRQHQEMVKARLDRVVANPGWKTRFSRHKITHKAVTHFDHKLVFLDMQPHESQQTGSHQFRFDACRLQPNDCKRVIEEAWRGEVARHSFDAMEKNLEL